MATAFEQEFERYKQQFPKLKVLVVGDIMLDRYVWGTANRLSEEAPVLVVDAYKKDQRLGGAGNVVNNLINLGVQVSLAGVIGRDFYGDTILKKLGEKSVDCKKIIQLSDRPTTTKKRVIARNQQVVRIDYEDKSAIDFQTSKALTASVLADLDAYSAIIVSDYAKGSVTAELLSALRENIDNQQIGLNKCPVMVDPKPVNAALYKGLNIIKPNRKEAEQISGIRITDRAKALVAAQIIKKELQIDTVLLSLGELGLLVLSDEHPEGLYSETFARKVFDVSGAGDALVASFTALVAAGSNYGFAAQIANLAAANVIAEVGTVPLDLAGVTKLVRDYES